MIRTHTTCYRSVALPRRRVSVYWQVLFPPATASSCRSDNSPLCIANTSISKFSVNSSFEKIKPRDVASLTALSTNVALKSIWASLSFASKESKTYSDQVFQTYLDQIIILHQTFQRALLTYKISY